VVVAAVRAEAEAAERVVEAVEAKAVDRPTLRVPRASHPVAVEETTRRPNESTVGRKAASGHLLLRPKLRPEWPWNRSLPTPHSDHQTALAVKKTGFPSRWRRRFVLLRVLSKRWPQSGLSGGRVRRQSGASPESRSLNPVVATMSGRFALQPRHCFADMAMTSISMPCPWPEPRSDYGGFLDGLRAEHLACFRQGGQ
jgi:hypothetical protein